MLRSKSAAFLYLYKKFSQLLLSIFYLHSLLHLDFAHSLFQKNLCFALPIGDIGVNLRGIRKKAC